MKIRLSSNIKKILMWIAIPLMAYICLVEYGYLIEFLSKAIRVTNGRDNPELLIGSFILQAFIASLIIAVSFAYVLVHLYEKFAPIAALIISIPVLYFMSPDISDFQHVKLNTKIEVAETLIFALLMIGCSWWVHKLNIKKNQV